MTKTPQQNHRMPSPTRSLHFTNNNTYTTVGVIQSFPPHCKPFYPNRQHNKMTGSFTTVPSYVPISLPHPRHQIPIPPAPPFHTSLHDTPPMSPKILSQNYARNTNIQHSEDTIPNPIPIDTPIRLTSERVLSPREVTDSANYA